MNPHRLKFFLLCLSFGLFAANGAESSPRDFAQPAWGRIVPATNATGQIRLEIRSWPADGKLALPTPFANLTSARLFVGRRIEPLKWVFNSDASMLHLELPLTVPATMPATVLLETTENSARFSDGRIVYSALDAKVQGNSAKLETHPGNHRISFWTDLADSVSWDYKPARWGMYDVEIAFAAQGGGGTDLHFELAGKTFTVKRPSTDSWYRYQTLDIGRLYLSDAKPFTVRAGCKALMGAAVMNLKSITLRPAPEGSPINQEASGAITLLARDATTHSITMRYEPAANKNCLGYWTNPNDWAEWEFTVTRPGEFDVEVWQGCGTGNGGSEVSIEVGGRQFGFVVEETGHFQSFVARRVGRAQFEKPGTYWLKVQPRRKQAAAVMDVSQVRLLPVNAP